MDPQTVAFLNELAMQSLQGARTPAPAAPAGPMGLGQLAAGQAPASGSSPVYRGVGKAPPKPGQPMQPGSRHPLNPGLVWDGGKWVEDTGMGTRPRSMQSLETQGRPR